MEAPETLGGGGWNLDGFPSSCIEGSHRRLGLLTAAGEGVTSGELGREMAGDVEGVGLCNSLLLAFTSTGSRGRARYRHRLGFPPLCPNVTGMVFRSREEERGRSRFPSRGMEDEAGHESRGAEIRAPRRTSSQASWNSRKEDARLARETSPRSRRAGSERLGGGVGEERAAGTEPGAPSRSACGIAPGQATAFSCPSLSSVLVAPGTKDLGGRWRVRRSLGAQPRGLLVVSGRVSLGLGLFILALLSLPWPLGRRAFFLSSLILSSAFFCLVTPPPAPRLE